MATYGRRSSQRHQRDEPAVTSSRIAEAASIPSPQASQVDHVVDCEDDPRDPDLLAYKRLTVSDQARKQAQEVGEAEIQKKANNLARYAMSCEYRRVAIRKEDIRREVLAEEKKFTRCFAPIFNAAQKILDRSGYHMVEVRLKGQDNAELVKQAQNAIRAASSSANGLRSRTQPPEDDSAAEGGLASNIWMLRCSMPPELVRELVRPNEWLTDAYAQAMSTSAASSSSQQRRPSAKAKAVLDWSSADHQDGEMGLLYVVLALILVNGRTITEATLLMYLRRLHLAPHAPLPGALRGTGPTGGAASTGAQSTQSQARAKTSQSTLEGFLTSMSKQLYLERQRADVGVDVMDAALNQAQTQTRRRGRQSGGRGRTNGADDETTVWEWRWGSRAESEVGEKRVAELITLLFTDPSSAPEGAQEVDEEDEQTRAIDRNRLVKRRKMLLTNIASVAGSQLID